MEPARSSLELQKRAADEAPAASASFPRRPQRWRPQRLRFLGAFEGALSGGYIGPHEDSVGGQRLPNQGPLSGLLGPILGLLKDHSGSAGDMLGGL